MDSFDKLRNRANAATASLESVISSLKELAQAQFGEVEANNELISTTRAEAETANNELKELKTRIGTETRQLNADIAPLRTEKHKLDGEISALVATKGDLKIDNVRLEKANKEFRDYEAGAWKVLDAKDKELLERERTVAEKEQFTPSAQSLLPPRT